MAALRVICRADRGDSHVGAVPQDGTTRIGDRVCGGWFFSVGARRKGSLCAELVLDGENGLKLAVAGSVVDDGKLSLSEFRVAGLGHWPGRNHREKFALTDLIRGKLGKIGDMMRAAEYDGGNVMSVSLAIVLARPRDSLPGMNGHVGPMAYGDAGMFVIHVMNAAGGRDNYFFWQQQARADRRCSWMCIDNVVAVGVEPDDVGIFANRCRLTVLAS